MLGDDGDDRAAGAQVIAEDLDGQHRRNGGRVQGVAPCRGEIGQRVGTRVAGIPAWGGDIDDGVQVARELPARLFEAGRVGVVEDDRVDVELLGGDLEVVAACAGDHHLVARIAEAFRNRASQICVAAGDEHLHHHDLLLSFSAEPQRVSVMLLDSS
jgi:hypothetical protein